MVEGSANIIADVEYDCRFDYLQNGTNHTNGGAGRHLGFGQMDDGRFYLVYGSDWQGELSRAVIVSADRVVREAIRSENISILKGYPKLKKLYDKKYNLHKPRPSKTFSIRINLDETDVETLKKVSDMNTSIMQYKKLKEKNQKKEKEN